MEVVIPVELEVTSAQMKCVQDQENDMLVRTELDLLDERRERAHVRNACFQAEVTRSYNMKV